MERASGRRPPHGIRRGEEALACPVGHRARGSTRENGARGGEVELPHLPANVSDVELVDKAVVIQVERGRIAGDAAFHELVVGGAGGRVRVAPEGCPCGNVNGKDAIS